METTKQPDQRGRKNNFDLLRLLFATIVCLVHLYQLSAVETLAFLERIMSSRLAVEGFFVVSGYLIFQSYHYTSSITRFYEKRVRRLYPAYGTVIVICATGMFWLSDASQAYFSLDLLRYIGWNLIFLNFMEPSLPGVFTGHEFAAVNGALWTLKIEVMFYAAVPIIFFLCRKLPSTFVLAGIYAASVIYIFACNYLEQQTGNPLFDMLARQLPGQMGYFIIGIAYFRYPGFLERYGLALSALSLAFFFIPLPGYIETILRPAAMGTLVIYAALHVRYLGDFCRFGDFSYGMYILHFPVIQTLIALGLHQQNPWLFTGAALSGTLLLSILLWHGVEKRFLFPSSHYLAHHKQD